MNISFAISRPPKLAARGVEGDEIDICNCWQINYGQKTSAPK
jgi:hypothetical protein